MVEWFPVSSIPKGKLNKKDTHLSNPYVSYTRSNVARSYLYQLKRVPTLFWGIEKYMQRT